MYALINSLGNNAPNYRKLTALDRTYIKHSQVTSDYNDDENDYTNGPR